MYGSTKINSRENLEFQNTPSSNCLLVILALHSNQAQLPLPTWYLISLLIDLPTQGAKNDQVITIVLENVEYLLYPIMKASLGSEEPEVLFK
jgi:hypothetical protein